MQKHSHLSSKKTIQAEDLWSLPLITSKQREVDSRLTRWLKRDISKLNVVATYNLLYNASLMVEQGIGYALCLDKLINTSSSNICFKPLAPILTVDNTLVWKRYQVFSKAAEQFLIHCKAAFE